MTQHDRECDNLPPKLSPKIYMNFVDFFALTLKSLFLKLSKKTQFLKLQSYCVMWQEVYRLIPNSKLYKISLSIKVKNKMLTSCDKIKIFPI